MDAGVDKEVVGKDIGRARSFGDLHHQGWVVVISSAQSAPRAAKTAKARIWPTARTSLAHQAEVVNSQIGQFTFQPRPLLRAAAFYYLRAKTPRGTGFASP